MNRRKWFRAATGTLAAGVMITPKAAPEVTVWGLPTPMCAVCNWQMYTLIRPTTRKGMVDAQCTNMRCSEGGIWKELTTTGIPSKEIERADS